MLRRDEPVDADQRRAADRLGDVVVDAAFRFTRHSFLDLKFEISALRFQMKYSISSGGTSIVAGPSSKLAELSSNVQAAMPLTQGLADKTPRLAPRKETIT